MEPRISFWGGLTKEGRIKNRWARALRDKDMASSLNKMRQVLEKLKSDPASFAHLWQPFLVTFLDATRARSLTASDLQAATEMGNALSGRASVKTHPEEIWFLVVAAYDVRGESNKAIALLTSSYNKSGISTEGRQRCATDLARRGARDSQQLNIYLDYLRRALFPARETTILSVLTSVCNVHFTSDNESIKQAGGLAQTLVTRNIPIPNAQTALGLRSLLIDKNPLQAAKHFTTAFQANRNDRLAFMGLLASLIQNRAYPDIAVLTRSMLASSDPTSAIIAAMLRLTATLEWLDSHGMAGEPPEDTQKLSTLKNLNLSRYVGDMLDLAIGRLYLLEGNAQLAAQMLQPLADKHPEQPHWSYYAAWAAALNGDHEDIARRFNTLQQWPDRWTLACLLLETNPALAGKYKVYAHLGETAKNVGTQIYSSVIEARVAFAHATRPPEVNWQEGTGSLEANLEVLRTVLAYFLYTRNSVYVTQMMALPLFRRLPLADRLLWQGLQALLLGNQEYGRSLLYDAAAKLGYQRAALVLAVYFLEQKKLAEAKQFLAQASKGRTDTKIELLQAYINGCENQTEQAIKQCERQIKQNEPRAYYLYGQMYLQRAAEVRRANQNEQAKLYYEQAANAFTTALKIDKQALPSDCEVLAYCATFLSDPRQYTGRPSPTSILHVLTRQKTSHYQPWLTWNTAIAQLWYGKPDEAATACEEIMTMQERSAVPLIDAAQVALAQTVARLCNLAENVTQAEVLVELLQHLKEHTKLQRIEHLAQLGNVAVMRLQYRENSEQAYKHAVRLAQTEPEEGALALLLAQMHLERGVKEAAIATLHHVHPLDNIEQFLCTSLAELLAGRTLLLEDSPEFLQNASQALAQGYNLLRAATATTTNQLKESYKAILAAMQIQAKAIAPIVNITRFLPTLCTYAAQRGTIPAYLVEEIRNVAHHAQDTDQLVNAARCASAVGEITLACNLWEQVMAHIGNVDSPLYREFADLLCYWSVLAHRSGNDLEAAQRLRQAYQELARRNAWLSPRFN